MSSNTNNGINSSSTYSTVSNNQGHLSVIVDRSGEASMGRESGWYGAEQSGASVPSVFMPTVNPLQTTTPLHQLPVVASLQRTLSVSNSASSSNIQSAQAVKNAKSI